MDLITELRRELLRATNKLKSDSFLTKNDVENLIAKAYEQAKQRISDDEVSIEDE